MSNEERIEALKNKIIKINNVSPSFCSAKWLQTTLYLQNGYNHSCHHPSPHKVPLEELRDNPAALSNSSFKKKQREMMLKGDRPKECDYCWNIEDLGKDYFSDRHYKTSDYWAWDRFEEVSKSNCNDNIDPSYLEVSFSNACNFKCSYCSPEVSSKWLEEINQHGPYPTTQSNHNLEWLKQVGRYPYKHSDDNPYVEAFYKWFPSVLKNLKVFRITGGEPLMSKDVWKVLDYIKDNPNNELEVAINTNLCVEDKLIDKLIEKVNELKPLVKRVDIYTSLESTGKQAEYSRYGLDYEQWNRNIRKVLDNTSSSVSIMTTVNVLSLPTTMNFIENILQLRREYNLDFAYNRIPLSINYLRWPPYLSVKILSNELRTKYAKEILESEKWLKYYTEDKYARIYLEEWDQIKRFCDYLVQDEDYSDECEDFVKFINEYDKRRGTNFIETFPEYKELIYAKET